MWCFVKTCSISVGQVFSMVKQRQSGIGAEYADDSEASVVQPALASATERSV